MRLLISETQTSDLTSVKMLWADGDVMRYVGYPEGLKQTDLQMEHWLKWITETPHTKHYTLKTDDLGFIGESFYQLRVEHTEAIIDIKLLKKARGKALGERALCFTLDQLFRDTPALTAVVDPHCENLGAISLYHKLGFQDDEIFLYENEPHQKMILTKDNWRCLRLEQVRLEAIDKSNYIEASQLKVKEDQVNFVATNAFSIAQTIFEDTHAFAIYSGKTMVGFMMDGVDPDDSVYWIIRLMIDQHYQGLGYGRKAMEIAMERGFLLSGKNKMNISFEPENTHAKQLYESLGFVSTGIYEDGEIVYEKTW